MSLFVWQKSYEIGVDEIDRQHRHLVVLLNELNDAVISNRGEAVVPRVLGELVEYVQLHFTAEEEVMRQLHYPKLDAHCVQHLDLTSQLLEMRRRYERDGNLVARELLDFLCSWLKDHILACDTPIGRFAATAD